MNRRAKGLSVLSATGLILSYLGGGSSASTPSRAGVPHVSNRPTSNCWGAIRSRNNDPRSSNTLYGVDGVSSTNVWAVGSHDVGLNYGTVGEHWDGARWTLTRTADIGFSSELSDVASIGTADAWAVGAYDTYTRLAEHWDGTGWFVTSPIPVGVLSELEGVAGTASNDVWTVGFYELTFSGPNVTLAYHWDGSAWALVATTNVGSSHNFLNAVAAISADDVWAVGQYADEDGSVFPLTEHWDGTRWRVVPSPGAEQARLLGVTALSSGDVWAVGDATGKTFTIHWNGSAWTEVPSPEVGTETYLWSVDGASSNDVWAVGYDTPNSEDWVSVILHWNGARWRSVRHPHPTGLLEDQYFYGVVALPGGEAWAVGEFGSGITTTYTQRFAAC